MRMLGQKKRKHTKKKILEVNVQLCMGGHGSLGLQAFLYNEIFNLEARKNEIGRRRKPG